jgi:hypothetical protein
MELTAIAQSLAAAGAAGGENLYIEDVFSTYLYTGTGSTQTITNGVDLSGEGGLVWIKPRPNTNNHRLHDTERGAGFVLASNLTQASESLGNGVTSFNSDGFTLGTNSTYNGSGVTFASWTFRKAPKFFDIVTYTGDGTSSRVISHNLDSAPGCIIIKRTDSTSDWFVFHRSATQNLRLDSTTAGVGGLFYIASSTSTTFTLGTNTQSNDSGGTYVAYLFAHDDGGFGDDGEQNVISCGSYTGNGGTQDINVGFEPQWLLIKRTNLTSEWSIVDVMRGMIVSSTVDSVNLEANNSNAEANVGRVGPRANGFGLISEANGELNTNASTYIYIAIRRGPMKTPTAGTEVYNAGTVQNNTGRTISPELGYPVDLVWNKGAGIAGWNQLSRLTGGFGLASDSTRVESNFSVSPFDNNTTVKGDGWAALSSYGWMFRRAPGFMDVVCYTGTGSSRTVAHNLGVVPELMIVKLRTGTTQEWAVYHSGMNGGVTPQDFYMKLNTTSAEANSDRRWNDTAPTSTVFTVGIDDSVNYNAGTLVAYLFASLAGVSDIGTYTGNGTSVTVTTGFQPRFILVKRTDSTGNWYVGDSARGLVAGDDPFLVVNTTDAEVTNEDWVDVSATGFTVNETAANACVNTGTYLYLAIA